MRSDRAGHRATAQRDIPSTGIAVENVSVTFGTKGRRVHALSDVSFRVPRGSFTSLIGQSGCGKSTLLGIMEGFITPTSGRVTLGGASANARGLRRAMVFQEYALFPWRTAARNVAFALEARGMKDAIKDTALEYLDLVGLTRFADAYPHELSGGMQQRVAIARALAYEPDYLLMDEPLGALDALTRDQLQYLIADLAQKFGHTVVYVTHNVSEAVFLSDEIIVLSPGPGRVKDVIHVQTPRPRDPEGQDSRRLVAHVTELITGGRPQSESAGTEALTGTGIDDVPPFDRADRTGRPSV